MNDSRLEREDFYGQAYEIIEMVENSIDIMEDNLFYQEKIEGLLSEKLGYSSNYIRQKFKEITGLTLSSYYIKRKISVAFLNTSKAKQSK